MVVRLAKAYLVGSAGVKPPVKVYQKEDHNCYIIFPFGLLRECTRETGSQQNSTEFAQG